MPISDEMMGDLWPAALPGADAADYGRATLEPLGRFEIRTFQTFRLTYTVGEHGLDDTGAIKIVHRWTSDGGAVQTDDPAAPNYVTATASNGVRLEMHVEPYPHQRPWYNGLRITVTRGYMCPGDSITVVYGDKTGGSPGFRLQSFPESAFEFKVLADPCAVGAFLPVASPHIEIVGAAAAKFVLVAPTLRRPGEAFSLGLRVEDIWGNATGAFSGALQISADGPVQNLPDRVIFAKGQAAQKVEGLSLASEGVTRFELRGEDGTLLARSNPLVVKAGSMAGFWGDLHGQSGETVGINPMREYLEFARDVAHLDVTSHQGNDFQITGAFWREINALAAEFNTAGHFTVFPGYEWSGNTPVGGDHNVFFATEGEQIHRSSHALLADRSDIDTDAPTLETLFAKLQGRDAVVWGHIGGRPADISRAEDARLRTAVEVHSDWGSFEWVMTDAFDLGYRVGLVCNSDGHKGAPGACYPGASEFGAYSGLTCYMAEELSRPAIFRAMRARHHYGTTGCRMHMEVEVDLGEGGAVYAVDPRIEDSTPLPAQTAIMGDIARTKADELPLRFRLNAHAPIVRVDVLRGGEEAGVFRPYGTDDLGNRLRLIWQGAEYRGRGRQVRWQGSVQTDAAIARMGKINAWNLERRFEQLGQARVDFDAITTGNFGGCDLWLNDWSGAVSVETGLVSGQLELADIGIEDTLLDAGGLGRALRLARLPERLEACDFEGEMTVPLNATGDTPLWIRVTTEDGFNAWSSPIYLLRG